jgi:hypothetical protein
VGFAAIHRRNNPAHGRLGRMPESRTAFKKIE